MDALNEFLAQRGIYTLVMILFFLGVYGMVLAKHYLKKLMAMMAAVMVLAAMTGTWRGRCAPHCGHFLLSLLCPKGRRYDSNPRSGKRGSSQLYQSAASRVDADGYRGQHGYDGCRDCPPDADQGILRLIGGA